MFHKEGYFIIITTFFCAAIALVAEYFVAQKLIKTLMQIGALVVLVLVLQFFRNPNRNTILNDQHLLAPADGKIVIIEEVYEKNTLKINVYRSPFLCRH